MNRYLHLLRFIIGASILIPGMGSKFDLLESFRPAAFEQFNPVNISNSSAESNYPSLAADPTGVVHLVWTENEPADQPLVLYTKLNPDGWTAPVDIFSSHGFNKLSRAQLLSSDDGYLHIFLNSTNGVEYSRVYAPLASSPRSWSPSFNLIQNMANLSDLDVAAFHQSLYMVIAISYGPGSGIYLAASQDSGISWTEASMVIENPSDDRMISQPRITVDASGKLHLIWLEHNFPESYPPIGVLYSNSLDGISWSRMTSLADGPYLEPELISINETEIHAVWSGVSEDRYKFHIWSRDSGESWFNLWRNEALGGLQGWPALAADSLGRLYWIQVGTIFNADRGDDLYGNIFLNNQWTPGIVLYDPPWKVLQNMKNVRAVISGGNLLTAAWMVPVTADNADGWQMDIQAATQILDAPSVAPIQLPTLSPTSVLQPTESSQPTLPAFQTAVPGQGEVQPVSYRPLNSILLGVAPAALLVALILLWVSQRARRK